MTNSLSEIYDVGVQLPDWRETLPSRRMYDSIHVDAGKRLHLLPSHPRLGEPLSSS